MREVEKAEVSHSKAANIDLGTEGRTLGRNHQSKKRKAERGGSGKRDPDKGSNTGKALGM